MRRFSLLYIFSLILVSEVPANAEAIFGEFGAPAWSRIFKYYETRFGAVASDERVLILPTATDAAWNAPSKTLRLVDMNKWGDCIPSFAWQYSANCSKRISGGYGYFLTSALVAQIDASGTIAENVKNALRRVNEEVQFTRTEYIAKVDEADKAYADHVRTTPPRDRLSKQRFLDKFEYKSEIEARQARLAAAGKRLGDLTKNLNDPDIVLLEKAQKKYDSPKQIIQLPPVPELLNDRERWQDYYISLIDKDIFKFLDEDVRQDQEISESSAKSEYFQSHWQASVGISFFGFGLGGSAEQTKRETHIRNNSTKIGIHFENIDTFNIVRGEWFDEQVIARFAPKLKAEAWTAIWGKNGQLELIPKTLLVGRGVSFVIYADSNSLDYLYDHFEAGGGISIGFWGIGIGAGGSYSSTKENTEIKKFSDRIVFRDLSGQAKVLGVLAKHYASSVPKPAFINVLTTGPMDAAEARELLSTLRSAPASELLKKRLDSSTLQAVTDSK
jgi:hypothetical protein